MVDAFSDYVTLLDDIGQIPVTARAAPKLSAEQRGLVMAQVIDLVRNRVLPQSDREGVGLEALFDDERGALVDVAGRARAADHEAILSPIDELARANPTDGARVQELLYRVHAAIASHFIEAELIHAGGAEPEPAHSVAGEVVPGHIGPSRWFG